MKNLNLKELQIMREALEHVAITADPEAFKSLRDKVDTMLLSEGYKLEIKAFEKQWKKIKK